MRVGLIILSFLATVNCGLLLVLLLVFGGTYNGVMDNQRLLTSTSIIATNNFVGKAIEGTATAKAYTDTPTVLLSGSSDDGLLLTATSIMATNNWVGTAIAQTATAIIPLNSAGPTLIITSTPTNTPTVTLTPTPKS